MVLEYLFWKLLVPLLSEGPHICSCQYFQVVLYNITAYEKNVINTLTKDETFDIFSLKENLEKENELVKLEY